MFVCAWVCTRAAQERSHTHACACSSSCRRACMQACGTMHEQALAETAGKSSSKTRGGAGGAQECKKPSKGGEKLHTVNQKQVGKHEIIEVGDACSHTSHKPCRSIRPLEHDVISYQARGPIQSPLRWCTHDSTCVRTSGSAGLQFFQGHRVAGKCSSKFTNSSSFEQAKIDCTLSDPT